MENFSYGTNVSHYVKLELFSNLEKSKLRKNTEIKGWTVKRSIIIMKQAIGITG